MFFNDTKVTLNLKLLPRDHGPGALVREDLQEERVRRPAVDDVRALHALRDGLDAALHLRDHTPRDHVLSHQVPGLVDRQRADERARVVLVGAHPGNVRHQDELRRAD